MMDNGVVSVDEIRSVVKGFLTRIRALYDNYGADVML
jgi:hypothetical protein